MICDTTDLWICVVLMALLFAVPGGFLVGWLFSLKDEPKRQPTISRSIDDLDNWRT